MNIESTKSTLFKKDYLTVNTSISYVNESKKNKLYIKFKFKVFLKSLKYWKITIWLKLEKLFFINLIIYWKY